MAVGHWQAGVREPGVVGMHGRAVSQAPAGGRVVFLEDFLEAVPAEPESRRAWRIKESVHAKGKSGVLGALYWWRRTWHRADGRGHQSRTGTRGRGLSGMEHDGGLLAKAVSPVPLGRLNQSPRGAACIAGILGPTRIGPSGGLETFTYN